jgi:hypothetical protein
MPTKNPRINVTFEEPTAEFLTELAAKEQQSLAGLVRTLALEALAMREDVYLSKAAEELDQEGVKTHAHDEAWK